MNLDARLTKLETMKVGGLGIRIFRTTDDVSYFESIGDGYDYIEAITGLDGNPPGDGRRMWTRAELDALERESWQLIIICYVKNWREVGRVAVVSEQAITD